MQNIAFIDLEFHKKTKSSLFFQNILKEHFNLKIFYDTEKDIYLKNSFDKYIYWQVIPDFYELKEIKDKPIIFIPMYDGLPLNKIVRERYKCFNIRILCFCKKVYDFFKRLGFECSYVQYFLPPLNYQVDYSKKNIFFWYRGNITWENVKKIIGNQNVSVTIKNNPDPGYKKLEFTNNEIKKYNISFLDKFFETKEEYIKHMAKHSIFIAPRKQEGIGMSFLESMSLGQCVIAYDDATMNEYIINNKNGILTKFDKETDLNNFSIFGKECKEMHSIGFNKRNEDIHKCIEFIGKDYNRDCKKITMYDYLIDSLIKIRRKILKLKKVYFSHKQNETFNNNVHIQ